MPRPKKAKPVAEAPQATLPDTRTVRVLRSFPNPSWLMTVDTKTNEAIKVRIPNRFISKLLGKTIEVTRLDGELPEYYKYQP